MNLDAKGKPLYAVGVSVLLTNQHGGLLLARRKNNSGAGLLSTPGGRIEFDDVSVEAAARREFTEETGAEVGALHMLGYKKLARFGNNYFMFYMHATDYTGAIRNLIPDKSEDWTFFRLMHLNYEICTEPADILDMTLERIDARRRL